MIEQTKLPNTPAYRSICDMRKAIDQELGGRKIRKSITALTSVSLYCATGTAHPLIGPIYTMVSICCIGQRGHQAQGLKRGLNLVHPQEIGTLLSRKS